MADQTKVDDLEDDLVQKNITIKRSQDEWLETSYINLSKFVRAKLSEEMEKSKASTDE